jgi:hypothetical protein
MGASPDVGGDRSLSPLDAGDRLGDDPRVAINQDDPLG